MPASPARPVLSCVIPLHDEEDNVGSLHAELERAATGAVGPAYEIVFVNDGSGDRTLARLLELRARDGHVRIVDLDGNFGEAAALSAGFAHARGEVVVTLDGDGQNDPADVSALLARLGPEVDVVSGRRRRREEPYWSRVLPSRVANWLVARATGVPVHDCGCGLKAYRRECVTGVRLARGMNRFLPGILGVQPGRVTEVWVRDRRRRTGRSHYGLWRTLAVLRDLPVLPLLARGARRPSLGGAYAATLVIALAAIVGSVGWPAGVTPALALAASAAAAGAGSIGYTMDRVGRARTDGVYRVRRVW